MKFLEFILWSVALTSPLVAGNATEEYKLNYDNQNQSVSVIMEDSKITLMSDYRFAFWLDKYGKEKEKKGKVIKEDFLTFTALLNNSRSVAYFYDLKRETLYALYNIMEFTSETNSGWAAVITAPVYSKSFQSNPSYKLFVNGRKILETATPISNIRINEKGVLNFSLNTHTFYFKECVSIKMRDNLPVSLEDKVDLFRINRCQLKVIKDELN